MIKITHIRLSLATQLQAGNSEKVLKSHSNGFMLNTTPSPREMKSKSRY
jgi:hypothetical protein